MDHVAFMKKEWRLIEKILSGKKTIESRWYASRRAPWGRIRAGETVYFKNSGEPVTAQATVARVLQLELTPAKVREILDKYGGEGSIGLNSIEQSYALYKDKKYCILVFLKDARKIAPFEIDKRGFGNMCAWISVDDIARIKKRCAL